MAQRTTRCWKCGKLDHTGAECWASERVCFNCQQPGHQSNVCTKPRGFLNRRCRGCGEQGHFSDDCINRSKWSCKNCKQDGHGHWECQKPRGYSTMKCFRCEATGHIAKECTNRSKWKCMICDQPGHNQWNCTQRGSGKTCLGCGEAGHVVSECKFKRNTKTCTNRDKETCHRCGSRDHLSKHCSVPWNRAGSASWRNRPQKADSDANDGSNLDACGSDSKENRTKHPKQEDDNKSSSVKTTFDGVSPANNEKIKSASTDESLTALQANSLNRQGTIAFASEDYDEAVSLFTKAISLNTTVASFYTNRAIAYAKIEDYGAALRDFQLVSSMETYKPTAKVLVHKARCLFFLESRPAALLALREALLCEPDDANALGLKNRILELEGHITSYLGAWSRQHWRMAGTSYESCLRVYAQEGGDAPIEIRCWGIKLIIVDGAWDAAAKAADIILRNEPKATEVMFIRGLVLFLTARLSDALVQINTLLKLDPDNHRAKTLRSRIKDVERLKECGNKLFRSGQWSDAIAQWQDALELVAENAEEGHGGLMRATLLLNKGTAMAKLEQFTEALKVINMSLTLYPNYFKALRARARIYVELDLHESAVEDFKASVEHAASKINAHDLEELKAELEKTEWRAIAERNKAKDYYKILGLPRSCTTADIRKAYRTESLKHHPDKGGIAEKFKLIAEAYSTLSDSQARESYDLKFPAAPSSFDDEYYSECGHWY